MTLEPDRNPNARPGAFHRPDSGVKGTEVEVSDLIAAHVRYLRPRLVVETGTFMADTAVKILRRLYLNAVEGHPGELLTFEVDIERADLSRAVLERAVSDPPRGLRYRVVNGPVATYPLTEKSVDIAFVDSAYRSRKEDIRYLMPAMQPQGLIFVHDTQTPHMRDMMSYYKSCGWSVVHYPTPRGLSVLQVPIA